MEKSFAQLNSSLPNLTDLKLTGCQCVSLSAFEQCMNLEKLTIQGSVHVRLHLGLIPALLEMRNLSYLKFVHVNILPASVYALGCLVSLHTMEFDKCKMTCNYQQLGSALAKTPIQSLIFRNTRCSCMEMEALLESLPLRHLFFGVDGGEALPDEWLLFNPPRSNPYSYLVERMSCSWNLNGVRSQQQRAWY